MEYSVEGAFADHLTFDNTLEGMLVLSRALDYETLLRTSVPSSAFSKVR